MQSIYHLPLLPHLGLQDLRWHPAYLCVSSASPGSPALLAPLLVVGPLMPTWLLPQLVSPWTLILQYSGLSAISSLLHLLHGFSLHPLTLRLFLPFPHELVLPQLISLTTTTGRGGMMSGLCSFFWIFSLFFIVSLHKQSSPLLLFPLFLLLVCCHSHRFGLPRY